MDDATGRGKSRRVALFYDAARAFDVKVMAGVASYFQSASSYTAFEDGRAGIGGVGAGQIPQNCDGIIGSLDNDGVAAILACANVPVVGFGRGQTAQPTALTMPYVHADNSAISRLAFD